MRISPCGPAALLRNTGNVLLVVSTGLWLLSTWATKVESSTTSFSCGSLIVGGAGPGGLYSAWRLIGAGLVDPEKTCVFEQSERVGGRMRTVRGDELPEELQLIGSKALDVSAYRAWPLLHTLVAATWAALGIETGCYDDIAFRTGDCASECDPARAIHLYIRNKYVPFEDILGSVDLPYNFGKDNSWDVTSTYLNPYDWLYGPYAPDFWADDFAALALSESAAERWAARDRIVEAARTFEVNGTPSTLLTLQQLATMGYNSDGVFMTQEDMDFFIEADCNTGEHILTRLPFFDTVVEYANYFATGLALDVDGGPKIPILEDGKQAGFDIVALKLVEILEGMGVQVFYKYQVKATRPMKNKDKWAMVTVIDLETDEEYRLSTEHTVLNIPSEYIRNVLSDNTIQKYGRDDLIDVFNAIETLPLLKAYPFYESAWWAKLGYTSGRLRTTLEIYQSRYHDGYANCTDADFTDCSGTLLGTYVQGEKGLRWARPYFPTRPYLESADGFRLVRRGQGPPEQDAFLDALHARNMESHRDALLEIGIDTNFIPAPDLCLVGDYLGSCAGGHPRAANSLEPGTIDEAVIEPFPGYNIHLVNEAYGTPAGWLQSSLLTAERMMYHYYGQDKPSWFEDNVLDALDADLYYKSVVGNTSGNGK